MPIVFFYFALGLYFGYSYGKNHVTFTLLCLIYFITIIISRCIHFPINDSRFSLFITKKESIVYKYHIFSIYSSVEEHTVWPLPNLAIVISIAINVYIYNWNMMILTLWGKYLEGEKMNLMKFLSLVVWRISTIFVVIYIHNNTVKGLCFSQKSHKYL